MSGHNRHGKVGALKSHQPRSSWCSLIVETAWRIARIRAKKRAANCVQIADVDERDVAIKAERLQDRRLWILGIEPIDLMKRSLDCKGAMPIDRRRSAKILVSFDHQNPMPGSRIKCTGGQAAKPGADNDRVELSGHAQPRSMRIFLMVRQFEFLP